MNQRDNSGFTMMEVMVAIAVTGMIATAIWSATSQTTKVRSIVEDSHDKYHEVRVAFDMISKDLSSTFLSMHRGPLDPSHDTIFIGTENGGEDSPRR